MAISRPFLLALLGVTLLAATVFAVQNARDKAADPAPAAQQSPAEQAAPAPAPPASPQELLASAFSADVTSAAFDATVTFSAQRERGAIHLTGAFEEHGEKALPEVDVQLRVSGTDGPDERAGFVTTGERAWFTRGNAAYPVPQSIWGEIAKARESGTAAESAGAAPRLDLDPSAWVKNVKSEGTEQLDGVQTTHVSAQLDSATAVGEVVKAVRQAAGEASPLPAGVQQQLRRSGLSNADVDVWVGEDKVMRRATVSVSGRVQGRLVKAELDVRLSGVNEPQDVARPANVKQGMLRGADGRLANGVLAGVAQASGLNPTELKIGVPVTNSHVKAERAVADNKKVVIFFQNPRALDDQAVADAVRSLDRRTKSVVVLTDVVENVDRYGSLVEDLGVNQAPAIVVIGRSGKASLIEGYTDAGSLAQVVADAR